MYIECIVRVRRILGGLREDRSPPFFYTMIDPSRKDNKMSCMTLQWLLNPSWDRGKKVKESYRDQLYSFKSIEELKAFVWKKCKPHVRNLESFKKGQKSVDYKAIFETIQEDKKEKSD